MKEMNAPMGMHTCSKKMNFQVMAIPDQLADRPTSLDKIKSADWSKVGMLYCQGGH